MKGGWAVALARLFRTCAACAAFSRDVVTWTDSASSPEIFAGRIEPHTTARERQHRIRILNVVLGHYGLSLSDWATSRYVLRSATGRTALVENLGELWPAAERLIGRPVDPFDPALLAALVPAGAGKAVG